MAKYFVKQLLPNGMIISAPLLRRKLDNGKPKDLKDELKRFQDLGWTMPDGSKITASKVKTKGQVVRPK